MKKYILVLDQGTTSSRSIIFDYAGQVISQANKEFKQFYPQPGWVEHDPEEILASQLFTINEVLKQSGSNPEEIAAIGITNQRETTVLWDKKTGKPLHKAIVWQCRRSKDICENLKADGFAEKIKHKTGLVTDAYFSGTKVKWLLDQYPEIRKMAENGEVAFGTIDSWLLYHLTGGKAHQTDYSNASRTLLFNINTLDWDQEILEKLDIPFSILPEVKSSSEIYGYLDKKIINAEIPISGMAGDQQAALFGQTCFNKGDSKNTYGTGCFILLNTGEEPVYSESGLLTSIAWGINGKVNYILEGSIFIGGAVIQWLRDELGIISNANESEELAMKVSENEGVYFVPAFTGLGTPYWNMEARGTIRGLTRGSNRNHLVRAALEAISYQTGDVIECMKNEANISGLNALRVDGGASVNNFLMQFQADLLDIPVERPKVVETTALGAAYLAGLAVGFWQSMEEIKKNHIVEKVFQPTTDREKMENCYAGWKMAIKSVT